MVRTTKILSMQHLLTSQKPQGEEDHGLPKGEKSQPEVGGGGTLLQGHRRGGCQESESLGQPASQVTTHLIDGAGGRPVFSRLRTRGRRRRLLLDSGLLLRQKDSKRMVTQTT